MAKSKAQIHLTNKQQLKFPDLVQTYIYKHHNFKLIFNKFKNIIGVLLFVLSNRSLMKTSLINIIRKLSLSTNYPISRYLNYT